MLPPLRPSTRSAIAALAPLALGGLAGPPQDAPPARALSLELTAQARLAGTVGADRATRFVARELERAGFAVELDRREVLLSLPRRVELGLYRDGLAADPFLERFERYDPDAVPPGDVPPFNAWSASGEVRAPVVDVGHARREDFERLHALGVELAGKIALARYGEVYRGVKVDLATEYGCVGVLLYSDPEDDGAARGEVWPAGPWKPDTAAQRGSISPIDRTPGDPSTPGFASPAPGEPLPEGRARLAGDELAAALPRVPCAPIGAAEAEAIRAALAVRRVRDDEGTTRPRPVGPGPVEARLLIEAPRELRTITNVLGRLSGRREAAVIAGNHRDAWVRGAQDAGSGTVALLRAAQHLGQRVREGWKPEHGITLAFWDAEEFGLVGSTEWAEAHADWLTRHAIAYVNADAAVSGTRVHASGTPGLEPWLARALGEVRDPEDPSGTLHAQWLRTCEGRPRLALPGSGSDFTVFLHHLDLPVLDVSFGGNEGGQYHTAFDDFPLMDRFLDPGWSGHEAAGRLLAELLARAADLGPLVVRDDVAARAAEASAREASAWLGEADAQRLGTAFGDLARAVEQGSRAWRAAAGFETAPGTWGELGDGPALLAAAEADPARARALADAALDARRPPRFYAALADPDGLEDRPWFRNRLWAPALEDGYGSETFPDLRRATSDGATLERRVAELVAAAEGLQRAWETYAAALAPERR